MTPSGPGSVAYSASTSYDDAALVADYEPHRFSGPLGRYRWGREQAGVGRMVDRLPAGVSVLDCPSGIGRWWPVLARRASSITAVDISPAMLEEARRRPTPPGVPVTITEGSAEALELADGSVDVVFSHALTKHLPIPVQYRVLSEFARVSRTWVLCSFGIFTPLTYRWWRRQGLVESFPLLPEQFDDLCRAAGLVRVDAARCTTPLGVEHSVLLRRAEAPASSSGPS